MSVVVAALLVGTAAYAAKPTPGAFDAAFALRTGPANVVEVQVAANEPVAFVDARANGGPWFPLGRQADRVASRVVSTWAALAPLPDGSVLQLRATSRRGAIDLSDRYVWPSGRRAPAAPRITERYTWPAPTDPAPPQDDRDALPDDAPPDDGTDDDGAPDDDEPPDETPDDDVPPDDAPMPRATTTFAASDPALAYEGRFDVRDPARPRCAWSACAVVARFDGTGAVISVDDEHGANMLDVVVDDGPAIPVALTPGASEVRVAAGLAAGPHTLRIVKTTEALFGAWTFAGLIVDDALPLHPVAPRDRVVEVIGDSISAGYGDAGLGPWCSFDATTSNGRLAYAALAAEALAAQYGGVAWSGKGVYRNRNADDPLTMRDLSLLVVPQDPTSSWTPSRPADVVVVNLGTNDFGSSVPPRADFVAAVQQLLDGVRATSPQAHVFVAVGPMMSDDWPSGMNALTNARSMLNEVVDERRQAGDARIELIEFPSDDQSLGLGCDYHPSAARHRAMADQLVSRIRAVTGW